MNKVTLQKISTIAGEQHPVGAEVTVDDECLAHLIRLGAVQEAVGTTTRKAVQIDDSTREVVGQGEKAHAPSSDLKGGESPSLKGK